MSFGVSDEDGMKGSGGEEKKEERKEGNALSKDGRLDRKAERQGNESMSIGELPRPRKANGGKW
jgi:hypothetical protein